MGLDGVAAGRYIELQSGRKLLNHSAMKRLSLLFSFLIGLALSGSSTAEGKNSYTIGLIAKSQSNPVFQAARVGAEQAAKELGAKTEYQSRSIGERRTMRTRKNRRRHSSNWCSLEPTV